MNQLAHTGSNDGKREDKLQLWNVEEGKEILEEEMEPELLDAALICAAQRVEHYEIAGYGCARTFAQRLGHNDIAELLQTTLDEEGNADKKLTQIAESVVNQEAEAVSS